MSRYRKVDIDTALRVGLQTGLLLAMQVVRDNLMGTEGFLRGGRAHRFTTRDGHAIAIDIKREMYRKAKALGKPPEKTRWRRA